MCIPSILESVFWCGSLGMKQSAPFVHARWAISALTGSPVQYNRGCSQALECRKALAESRPKGLRKGLEFAAHARQTLVPRWRCTKDTQGQGGCQRGMQHNVDVDVACAVRRQ